MVESRSRFCFVSRDTEGREKSLANGSRQVSLFSSSLQRDVFSRAYSEAPQWNYIGIVPRPEKYRVGVDDSSTIRFDGFGSCSETTPRRGSFQSPPQTHRLKWINTICHEAASCPVSQNDPYRIPSVCTVPTTVSGRHNTAPIVIIPAPFKSCEQ